MMKTGIGNEFIEIRCNKDNTLLFRARHVVAGEIEIKCRRCGEIRLLRFPCAGKPRPGGQSEAVNVAR